MSTVINESSRTASECALHCNCSAETETGNFLNVAKCNLGEVKLERVSFEEK